MVGFLASLVASLVVVVIVVVAVVAVDDLAVALIFLCGRVDR